MISIEKDEQTFSLPGNGSSFAAPPAPLLPQILEKYNTEEVKFLDVGPTQHALRGKTLSEIFPATHHAFAAMFDSEKTNLTTVYFQLSAGYPEGFKVRMPVLKVTKTSYQIGLLEYSNLNPKNSVFRQRFRKFIFCRKNAGASKAMTIAPSSTLFTNFSSTSPAPDPRRT